MASIKLRYKNHLQLTRNGFALALLPFRHMDSCTPCSVLKHNVLRTGPQHSNRSISYFRPVPPSAYFLPTAPAFVSSIYSPFETHARNTRMEGNPEPEPARTRCKSVLVFGVKSTPQNPTTRHCSCAAGLVVEFLGRTRRGALIQFPG